MKTYALTLVALLFVLLSQPSVLAQERTAEDRDARFDFYARGPYRESVPRPQSILRYDVGEFHTNYATMERVINAIAQAASDRVRVFDMGQTNEYRTMHLVAISSPENIARLDEIRTNVARLADPRSLSDAEARRITAATPVVVWLNYTIHGNESASFETMMQVVYQLAASNEPATLEALRNSVALINVCANPDGHERFVTWYNSFGMGNPAPEAGEHDEPWSVYGRVNRFRFDLNRDNIATSQVETRNVQRAFREWNPQVFVDHHGQTSQFFFPPAALPVNPNLPQEETARWLTTFGRANAAQFDQRVWDYYVRDIFDLYYPGYWDSWPALNGATGMTYETDAGGWKGLRWRRDDGTIVTMRSGIAKHFVASLTTLETAARNREARLTDFLKFKQTAIEEGRRGPMRRVVLRYGPDVGAAKELVENLLRAGIEVRIAREPFRSERAHSYAELNAPAAPRTFPAGSIVIDLAQPQKRLAKALLEPHTEQDAEFVREQLARYARNQRRGAGAPKEEYGFYDVTAWSLPLAFGVEAYWTEDAAPFEGPMIRLTPPGGGTPASPEMVDGRHAFYDLSGLANSPGYDVGVLGPRASVAYVIPYDRNGSAALIARLLREDFRLAVATRPLNAGGRDWPRGTVVARISRNPESLHERINALARESGAAVFPVNTGFAETGVTGVGSETVVSLRRPRIIVAADEPVSVTSYGSIWWTFDRMGVEFTPMTIDAIRRARLDDYNVIILPDGSPARYFSAFGKPGVETLRGWVQRGGTLVLIKGAAVFGALKDVNLTTSRLVGSEEDEASRRGADARSTPTPQATPTPDTAAANAQGTTTQGGRRPRQPSTQTPEQQQISDSQTEKMEGAPPDLPPIASPSSRPGAVPEPVPGAIFRATLDRTTPLTYGYEGATLPVLVDSAYFFRPSKEGVNALVFSSEDDTNPLRISGFVWPDTEKLLRGTAYVMEEPTGRGRVVLFAEDPNFRAIWRSTTRLFFNSFLFQPAR